MDDLISRQAAIDKVDRIVKVNHLTPDMVWFTPNGVKTLMEDLPSADVAPVRHGHWIKISPAGIYECSECQKNVMTSDIDVYEYCHGCGAKMDGENNE